MPCVDRCPDCPARHVKCVAPERAASPRLIVVGEAPGRHELETGRPFIGASGRMMMRGLRTLGLARHDVHWTNAALCGAADQDLKPARKACQERLTSELAEVVTASVEPPPILTVGAMGTQSALRLTKRPQILKWRGSVSKLEVAPGLHTHVLPTVHPAFAMRVPAWRPVLERDVARLGRVLANGFTPPELAPGRRIVIAKSEATLRESLGQLGREVGFDVETVGLGPTETALVCFALSDGPLTVVVPWSRAPNGREPHWRDPRTVAGWITEALRTRVAVTHNGPAFDHIVAQRYGIHVGAWEDTILAYHALESHLPKNLGHVVTQFLDVPPWKQWEDRNATIDRLHIYNARDTLYTILAWHELKQRLEQST